MSQRDTDILRPGDKLRDNGEAVLEEKRRRVSRSARGQVEVSRKRALSPFGWEATSSRFLRSMKSVFFREQAMEGYSQSLVKGLLEQNYILLQAAQGSVRVAHECIASIPIENKEVFYLVLNLVSSKEGARWMKGLQGTEAKSCINILDKIGAEGEFLSAPHLFKAVLDVLTKLCIETNSLPPSCNLPSASTARTLKTISKQPVVRGGYADIWRGQLRGQAVAIKQLPISDRDDVAAISKSFTREVIYWKYIRHPNIVPFLGINTTLFRFSMVSPWMDNGNVRQYLRKRPEANRLKLLVDVTSGLERIHTMCVIHGDLKADNILVDDGGNACLTDFGLAVLLRTLTTRHTLSESYDRVVGTAYMISPELYHPERFGRKNSRPTKESDIYALAMVMIESFATTSLFPREWRPEQIMFRVIEGERPHRPDSAMGLGLSDGVWSLIEECWNQEWSRRPDASYLLKHLNEAEQAFTGK